MALRLGARNCESGASIKYVRGSSSLPSFLPFFLAIFGHISLVIIYRLCDKNVRENYFFMTERIWIVTITIDVIDHSHVIVFAMIWSWNVTELSPYVMCTLLLSDFTLCIRHPWPSTVEGSGGLSCEGVVWMHLVRPG